MAHFSFRKVSGTFLTDFVSLTWSQSSTLSPQIRTSDSSSKRSRIRSINLTAKDNFAQTTTCTTLSRERS